MSPTGPAQPETFPDLVRDREVIHNVDNTAAIYGAAKGCPRDVDSGRIVHSLHSTIAALGATVWFEFVPTKSNLADLPSRGDTLLLDSLGSALAKMQLPPTHLTWLAAFDTLFR